jgi:hypothetical protein
MKGLLSEDDIKAEEKFQHLLQEFEKSDDPIAVELRTKIMESAINCPYDKDTCPYLKHN